MHTCSNLTLHMYVHVYTCRAPLKELSTQSRECEIQDTSHLTLRQDKERRKEREREGQRGETPNHRALPNSISPLPHGCAIHYDHTRVHLFGDTFGILHPFPELGQANSPIPMPHSPFQHPSSLTYCHRSWSWPVCVQVLVPPTALRGREQGEPQTHVDDHCKWS